MTQSAVATSTVPILLYHSVSAAPSDASAPFTVTPQDFERHLDAIVQRGLRCMTVSDYLDARTAGTLPVDEQVALITFDDGYLDFVETCLPLLAARKLPSTMYITTGWMSDTTSHQAGPDDPMMAFNHLADLESAQVEIGAHSHAHLQMDTLSAKHCFDELTRSKHLLEDTLGHGIRSFAYPHGYNSARIRKQVTQAGYDSATAVRNALSPLEDHPLRLARLMLMHDTSVADVEQWLDGRAAPVASRFESPKTTGWRAYRRAKAVLTGKPGSAYL
jgi:peptidoglycan/xylan/chitin deacetylase (PgdA/CDA1 family)